MAEDAETTSCVRSTELSRAMRGMRGIHVKGDSSTISSRFSPNILDMFVVWMDGWVGMLSIMIVDGCQICKEKSVEK